MLFFGGSVDVFLARCIACVSVVVLTAVHPPRSNHRQIGSDGVVVRPGVLL